MAEQKQVDHHEHTFSHNVRIRDVVQKTCQRRWTIGKSGERGSEISVLPARHDDDDCDDDDYPSISIQFNVLCCHLLIHAHIYIYILDTYRRNDKDAGRLLYKYMYLSLYCKGSKRVTQRSRVRGSWWPNINCNILTPTLMAVNVMSFSFSRCSTGGPGAHSAGWWLSLLHLFSNFSGPELNRGPRAP